MNAMKLAMPLFVALAYGPAQGLAVPILGSALKTFAVLGETSVTNVPASTINGNVGVSAGASITGFSAPTPGVSTPDATFQVTGGDLHQTTALAAQAQLDLDAAILAVNAGAGTLIGPVLSGTILPGIYDVGAAPSNVTGALILDGAGSNTAVWRFRFSGDLIASTGSTVSVINVGDGSGVGIYWTVADGATLNGNTFAGNVFARTLISSDGDSDGPGGPDLALTLACGRLASSTANVTLIMDTISIGCGTAGTIGFGSGGFDQAGETGLADVSIIPEPATLLLFGFGLAGLFASRKRLHPVA